jgi:hypothetical protein
VERKDRRRGAPVNGGLEFRLPRHAGPKLPLVQERSQTSFTREACGEQLHLGLVVSFMGEEDVLFDPIAI